MHAYSTGVLVEASVVAHAFERCPRTAARRLSGHRGSQVLKVRLRFSASADVKSSRKRATCCVRCEAALNGCRFGRCSGPIQYMTDFDSPTSSSAKPRLGTTSCRTPARDANRLGGSIPTANVHCDRKIFEPGRSFYQLSIRTAKLSGSIVFASNRVRRDWNVGTRSRSYPFRRCPGRIEMTLASSPISGISKGLRPSPGIVRIWQAQDHGMNGDHPFSRVKTRLNQLLRVYSGPVQEAGRP